MSLRWPLDGVVLALLAGEIDEPGFSRSLKNKSVILTEWE